ncbi:bifunctional 2-polyprenyl-6-hydroxyphenol methylase/3-demethylubiquinol 3-O-methyltransferase UbiG [Aldersonia sp. NBC_00410]|uniref:bifunctional 2-polyprenyl-6-hydroxyphenol methylase/3-demethylubiquinol 3-O-methyltransferase UbiG n=1 Tax=Aldersonia sp. NBC_00410 TaxID=2975954 RepID=UPI002257A3AE|nr:bifunctional 2-polyprenyl-6-hydroxyphenol methylase/3-demethylubiquinol 3-O-methyltransferase UbiG [Aldersonia sp. NBC_00410]MCX5046624.1 bifunctional 2-polyprenyl-6-hydroxyphenol methylase/3-demethylubiquinol 3-O-methyltransferase UbiG [Aldersonia sp. NBC_00410]
MAIDNDVYDRIGAGWWDEENPLNMLAGSMTPARFSYFTSVLRRHGISLDGVRALDVGCGGGFMAEQFARSGARVLGVDPSEVSIAAARRHAAAEDLPIAYRAGVGERLPVADAEFDIAYCCDVLEHVEDLDRVLAETARAIAPGGFYFFDTLNRTWLAKLLMIKIPQDWRLTRVFDTPVHDYSMFITPAELGEALRRNGFVVGEFVGLGPRPVDPRVAVDLVRARLGRVSFGEFSRRLRFGRLPFTRAAYMGYAVRFAG